MGCQLHLQPPGGAWEAAVCRGVRAKEDGGVRPTGEPGRERIRSCHPHLHLLQPDLLQPLSEGTQTFFSHPKKVKVHAGFMLCRLFPQDQSDIQIECSSEDRLATQRICNISVPFMKSLSQVGQSYFHSNYDFGMKKGSTTCSFLIGYYCCPDTTALCLGWWSFFFLLNMWTGLNITDKQVISSSYRCYTARLITVIKLGRNMLPMIAAD